LSVVSCQLSKYIKNVMLSLPKHLACSSNSFS
jgi:hypothetical protein